MSFVLKSLFATILIVLLMQVEVGGRTLESRAQHWLVSSEITRQLRQVADGGIKLSKDAWMRGKRWMGSASTAEPRRKSNEWKVDVQHQASEQFD